jgi:hypothetical protein
MGTRSRVGIMQGNVCKSVYCHYDGYLDHTGRMLLTHWDEAEVLKLIKMGDNSGIQESVEEMNFYKDRGETGVGAIEAHSFREFLDQVQGCFAEYYYVMRDGVWYAGCVYDTDGLIKGGLVPLDEALADVLLKQAIAEDE